MRLRKLMCTAMSAAIVASMAGCGQGKPAETTAAPAAAETTKAEETKAEETKAAETKAAEVSSDRSNMFDVIETEGRAIDYGNVDLTPTAEELEAMKKEPAYGKPVRYWMSDGCTSGPNVANLLGYYEEAGLTAEGVKGTSYTEAADALKKQLNRRRHNRTGQLPALETELAELDRQLSESNSLARQLVQARSEVEALSRRAEILQAELTDCDRWEAAQRRQALSGAASAAEQAEVRAAQVQANADSIITELKAGRDCAFATLGDAMTYSTFGYVLEIIREAIPGVELEIVPGITSFATLTAKAGTVLVENGEQLRVIPSFKSEMAETLDFPKGSTTILLKTYRSRKALVERLRREENVEILYGEHLAMEGQTLLTDLDAVADRPEEYLSLIMVPSRILWFVLAVIGACWLTLHMPESHMMRQKPEQNGTSAPTSRMHRSAPVSESMDADVGEDAVTSSGPTKMDTAAPA